MTANLQGKTWFLAQVKPNCAHIAERNLDRQGFRIFLPREQETRRRKGRFVTAERPLFPGYVFVAFDAAQGYWRKVNSTYGVSRLVRFGPHPAPVPEALVSQLRARCDDEGRLAPAPRLAPGDAVTLATGPFAGFVAEVDKLAPDRRVWVLMEIMGGQKRVKVAADELRGA